MATLPLKASRNEQPLGTVDQLGLEVLPNLRPIQSRLGPSDYHLFGQMKKMLGGQKFAY